MSASGVKASVLVEAARDHGARLIGDDVFVSDLHHDSRNVAAGSGFVAIRGAHRDGHSHVGTACASGARLVVVDHVVDTTCAQLIVDDTRSAMPALAAAVHRNPSAEMKMVGVTGTNGKTTVTHMLESIIATSGQTVGIVGTIGSRIAGELVPQARTTPEATDLHRLLRMMVGRGVAIAALEVSSHALVFGRADAIVFDVAGFTNLSQDHLDFHGTMEEYFAAKAELFRPERARHGVIWVDDPAGARLASSTDVPVTTVGFGGPGSHDVGGEIVASGPGHSDIEIHLAAGTITARVPVAGRFNAANALLAASIADRLGINRAAIADGIERLPPIPGRFEQIPNDLGFSVVIDYAHTPEAVADAIGAAGETCKGRVIAVAGAAGDRDTDKRIPMGRAAARADVAIITSDNPRSEDPAELVEQVVAGAGGRSAAVLAEVDRRQAIRRAIRLAEPGDVILVLGKGHEPYQEFAGVTIDFDDRVVAAAELAALSGGGA